MRPMHDLLWFHASVHGSDGGSPGERTGPLATERHRAALRWAPRLAQFAAVAHEEHMTRAADLLGVPQSTLSRSIARLEADLGVALFVRRGRALRLTRAGRTFLGAAERALAELDAGLAELTGEADAVRGRVALAFLHTLGAHAVPALLREFRADHPDIRFDLVQGSSDAVLDAVRSGAADVCLTSPLPVEPGLAGCVMHEQELRLAVPAGHRLAGLASVRLAEAAAEQFVGFLPAYGMRRTSDVLCQQAGFTPRLAFEGQDVETVRGLVAAGLGVALLPHDPRRDEDGVAEVVITDPPASRTIALAWSEEAREPPPARAFRQFVLRAGPALIAGGPSGGRGAP
jgi:DNA-binding transcriptional LysR family regulator